MKNQIDNMLFKGAIRESHSLWSAPAILVHKLRLDGQPNYRFCVDFRALNVVIKFDPYPLPEFEEATSKLYGSRYFSILDYCIGFWQINIKEERNERTVFTVPFVQNWFNRLPFGQSNSPANFRRLMDIVLKILVGEECYVLADYVIVSSKAAGENASRLENVLARFEKSNLQLHPRKCVIAQPQVHYLVYVVSRNGVSASAVRWKLLKISRTRRS